MIYILLKFVKFNLNKFLTNFKFELIYYKYKLYCMQLHHQPKLIQNGRNIAIFSNHILPTHFCKFSCKSHVEALLLFMLPPYISVHACGLIFAIHSNFYFLSSSHYPASLYIESFSWEHHVWASVESFSCLLLLLFYYFLFLFFLTLLGCQRWIMDIKILMLFKNVIFKFIVENIK